MNTPTRNRGGGGWGDQAVIACSVCMGKDAVGTRGETGRLFFSR